MGIELNSSRREFLAAVTAAGISGLASRLANGQTTNGEEAQWNIGIYTRPWDQFDYRVALDAIAESGYRYVGLMTTNTAGRRLVVDATLSLSEVEKVAEEIRQRALRVCSVYGGDIPVDQSLAAGIESLKRLIDNCVAVGAVIAHGWNRSARTVSALLPGDWRLLRLRCGAQFADHGEAPWWLERDR